MIVWFNINQLLIGLCNEAVNRLVKTTTTTNDLIVPSEVFYLVFLFLFQRVGKSCVLMTNVIFAPCVRNQQETRISTQSHLPFLILVQYIVRNMGGDSWENTPDMVIAWRIYVMGNRTWDVLSCKSAWEF